MQSPDRIDFPTDYPLILERMQAIDPIQYAKTRNYLNGDITYLSPYISRGVISVKQVLENVLKKGYSIHACEKLIQELAWREYYQRIWQTKNEGIWQDLKQPQPDTAHREMIASLQKAETGITVIDAEIRNLYAYGYLHNHSRMYLASIACNIGKAHWSQPSKWMYYHLLDGDIASNNCSWQWVAGAFSNKKYYCNQENINRFTFSNQSGTFLDKSYTALMRMAIPSSLKATVSLDLVTSLPASRLPAINTHLPTLIYNTYNLDPLWRKEEQANRVLLLEPSHFRSYPVSDRVLEFIGNLAKNIPDLQVYVGEVSEIQNRYVQANLDPDQNIIAKEHPAFVHYPGIKDPREWIFPNVTGYSPSFFNYWKKCQPYLTG